MSAIQIRTPIATQAQRLYNAPIDATEVHPSREAAEQYAAENPTAYAGQSISFFEDGVQKLAVVQPDGSIKDVGGTVIISDKSVTVNSGDIVSLTGNGSEANPIAIALYRALRITSLTATVLEKTKADGSAGGVGSGTEWEKGTVITAIRLEWLYADGNGLASQTITPANGVFNPSLEVEVRKVDITGLNINHNSTQANRRYILTARDNKNYPTGTAVTANREFSFLDSVYWGVSTNETITAAEILAASSALLDKRNQTRTFDCSGGRYIWFAWPSGHSGNPTFTVGGLPETTFNNNKQTISGFVNSSGYAVPTLDVYRTGFIQYGESITVIVS